MGWWSTAAASGMRESPALVGSVVREREKREQAERELDQKSLKNAELSEDLRTTQADLKRARWIVAQLVEQVSLLRRNLAAAEYQRRRKLRRLARLVKGRESEYYKGMSEQQLARASRGYAATASPIEYRAPPSNPAMRE